MAINLIKDHHLLTRNFKLNGNYVSNDGGDEGVTVDDAGDVGVNIPTTITPSTKLEVFNQNVQYSTGTARQTATFIVGSGTTFTAAMVGGRFIFDDGTDAGIIRAFSNTNTVEVSTNQTVGSHPSDYRSYKIYYPSVQIDTGASSTTLKLGQMSLTQVESADGSFGASIAVADGTTSQGNLTLSADHEILINADNHIYFNVGGSTVHFDKDGDTQMKFNLQGANGASFELYESAGGTDKLEILTVANGTTMFTTTDYAGNEADMNFTADGYIDINSFDGEKIELDSGGDIILDANTGYSHILDFAGGGSGITRHVFEPSTYEMYSSDIMTIELNANNSTLNLYSMAEPDDYVRFACGSNGSLGITTHDDVGTLANCALNINGNISLSADDKIFLESVGDIEINTDSGNVKFADGETDAMTIDMGTTSGAAFFLNGAGHMVFGIDDGGRKLYLFDKGGEYILGNGEDLNLTSGGDITLIAGGNVGIRTGAPDKALEINDASGDCLRLTHNDYDGSATQYADFTVADDGELTITTTGTDADLTIEADGHVEFDGCAVGFDLVEPTYDSTTTIVDFRTGNKQLVTFDNGDITNLSMYFPATSGNFVVLVKQDGTGGRTITNYRTYDVDVGNVNAVRFPGAANPNLTDDANFVDIISVFWDADHFLAYGIASLNFDPTS